jgi:hypothetical protein
MVRIGTWVGIVLAVLAGAARADARGPGCEKDTDCKGDRICEAGECVSPKAQGTSHESAAPAAYDDGQPVGASAGEPPPAEGGYGVEAAPTSGRSGLLLRGLVGVGYNDLGANVQGVDLDETETLENLDFRAGGQVGPPNLFITGEAFLRYGNTPTFSAQGMSQDFNGINTTELGIGPGIDYYVMPSNVYVGATVAYVHRSYSGTDQATGQSASATWTGFGVIGDAGKEWMVSPNTGLGLALQLYAASLSENGTSTSGTELGGLLSLSVTYAQVATPAGPAYQAN